MNKDLKDERNNNRWNKICKMPLKRIIRLFDADTFMRSEKGLNIDAAIHAEIYHKNSDKHFKDIWERINKSSS